MKVGKALFAVAVATALLGTLVSSASAGRLSSSSQTIRIGFPRINFAGGFGTTECPITMEGSFHSRSITKTAGALAGFITRAILGTCIRGRATLLTASLPWHTTYGSFTGTLPNITSINATFSGAQWQITEPVFGLTCLASGGRLTGALNREAGGGVTSVTAGGRSETNCGLEGTLSGTSNATTELNGSTRIRVTLI